VRILELLEQDLDFPVQVALFLRRRRSRVLFMTLSNRSLREGRAPWTAVWMKYLVLDRKFHDTLT
jgi:hypothetical protein